LVYGVTLDLNSLAYTPFSFISIHCFYRIILFGIHPTPLLSTTLRFPVTSWGTPTRVHLHEYFFSVDDDDVSDDVFGSSLELEMNLSFFHEVSALSDTALIVSSLE
jgi:hypothetical protein